MQPHYRLPWPSTATAQTPDSSLLLVWKPPVRPYRFNLTAQIKSSISSSSLQINKSSSSSAKDLKAAKLRQQNSPATSGLKSVSLSYPCLWLPTALLCKTHAMRHKHGSTRTHGCKPHGACDGVLASTPEPAPEHASRHACPVSSFKPELSL